jgi:hypothetical protein
MKRPVHDVQGRLCGCCEGTQRLTPKPIANRPGLEALAYRIGTQAAFLETMKARLSDFYLDIQQDDLDAEGRPKTTRVYPLRGLTTRAAEDPSIALLDAWATLADVLTFYQERIANEGYLRTATERRSILELARLVGYALRPGVASTVYLAYTLDDNAKEPVIIPVGARAQSVPGPDELPQSFETVEKLEARAAWNLLKPRMTRPQTADTIRGSNPHPRVYLKGISTNLKPNDPLLIDFADGVQVLYRVMDVKPDAAADRTLVTLQEWRGAAQAGPAMASPEAITSETKRQLSVIIARYLGEEAERINLSRGAMFGRVSAYLESLQQQLVEDVPFPTMLEHLNSETVPRLAAERELAQERGYADLGPWLENMVAELSGAAERASVERAEALAREFAVAAMPGNGGARGRGVGVIPDVKFKDVLSCLVKSPSVPPRNALVLKRRISTAFQLKANTPLQVMGAFRADVRESLPAVVANTKVTPDVAIKVYALRVKAALFGHNAPRQPEPVRDSDPTVYTLSAEPTMSNTWGSLVKDANEMTAVALDAVYDQIMPGDLMAIDDPVSAGEGIPPKICKVAQTQQITMEVVGMATKVSVLTADQPWLPPEANEEVEPTASTSFLRGTTIYAQSEELALAEEPIDDPICGSGDATNSNAFIELDGLYSELQASRWLIVSGERTDIQTPDPDDPSNMVPVTGVKSSELVMLAEVIQRVPEADQAAQASGYYGYGPQPVRGERIHTYIRFDNKLEYCYKRDTVKIYGNVVKATHGETRNEVLGSGDGSQAFPSFVLKQPPLTFVAAPTPAGAESTLHVRVNDVEWHETDSLAGLGPTDRSFITRTDDEGRTTVIFGNGRQAARPPTGIENIKAVYRSGIGKAGNVRAEQISLLVTRPLDVKEVINPMRASGGADKESRDQARKHAPLAVLALDRLVSTQDYADFARTFAGIGKASAARLTDGRRQLVHVTIAGADDIPIEESSDLYHNLVKALRDSGDPYLPIMVEMRELMLIVLSANIRILPDYQWESVVTKIRARLLDTFSFERRELGQDVLLSEAISTIQSVEGVAYVDVDMIGGVSEKDEAGAFRTPDEIAEEVQQMIEKQKKAPEPRIQVDMAGVRRDGTIRPAQLAFLTPDVEATLILNEVKS